MFGAPGDGIALDEAFQLFRPAWMLQLAKRLRLNLSNTFAGDLEVLTHLLKGMVAFLTDPETHAQDFLLTWSERLQNLSRLLLQIGTNGGVHRRHSVLVLDKVAQVRVAFLTDRRF